MKLSIGLIYKHTIIGEKINKNKEETKVFKIYTATKIKQIFKYRISKTLRDKRKVSLLKELTGEGVTKQGKI
jgi:hypothetical protein